MRRRSIYFSIVVTFGVSLVLLFASFFILLKSDSDNHLRMLSQKSHMLTKLIRDQSFRINPEKFEKTIDNLDIKVCNDHKILLDPSLKTINERKNKFMNSRIFSHDGEYYFLIQNVRFGMLFRDTAGLSDNKTTIITIFCIIVILFVFLFFTTIKKLSRIKELRSSIKQLGTSKVKYDDKINDKNMNEIEELLYEFHQSAKRLQDIKNARNVFIRNIMHELKTPIMKGNLVTEFIEDDEHKIKLKKIFSRLDELINQFASIERVISNTNSIAFKTYFLEDIVDNAKDLLLLDEEVVNEEYENIKLQVDFELFSIVIKNLMDNAIKYSNNNKVSIKTSNNSIQIINVGEKLEFELQSYFEPFFKGENEYKNNSFGLGLYIVKNILDVHKFKISYDYIDNQNIFSIEVK
ncbi:MAG: sensor histidine kinase [uncultured Campylobacterales bacterium]|uniref:histidine kinase n=1 Tax=uncultured Campylobacterales bacterium TaxID=352960 RepID=A0A6S6SWV0_9BACT|nr:MAG: sensor histidine kinase [uncultured Campylobacterales bacterium]